MSDPHVTDSPRALPVVACSDLLAAETTLKALTDLMHAEYVASDNKWPRDWMQNHVNESGCNHQSQKHPHIPR